MIALQIPLTVPPMTGTDSPARVEARPAYASLKSVSFQFPPGVLLSVGVRLLDRGKQIFPADGWARGDGNTITCQVDQNLTSPPLLVIEGISEAEDYNHTPVVILYMER